MPFGGEHPKLNSFVRQYERQISDDAGREWPYLTSEEMWFLDEIWGHLSHYDYSNLAPGFPLEGFPPLDYCTYFCFTPRKNKRPVVFEVVDYRTYNLKLSAEEYSDFVNRREELERQGFAVVRLIKSDSRYEVLDAREAVFGAITRSIM